MDWSKAKTVLIFSFLLLNVLLGYQLWMDSRDRMNSNPDLTGLTEETRRMMQEKQIRLESSIPSETPYLREISVRLDNRKLVTLPQPVDSKIVFSDKDLRQGLKGAIPNIEAYEFDQAASTESVWELHQLADNRLPMFDVKLELVYKNQKIDSYRQQVAEVLPSDSEKDQKVLPAYKAVGSLIDNKLPVGTVIKDVRLGYHGQLFNSDDQVLAPSWRIVTESGQLYYVHAISGAVEVTQK